MRFVLASYLAVALATPRDNVSQDSAAGPPHDVERGPPSRTAALKTFSRAVPLYSDAVAWDAIEWRKYKTIIISGPQRSGTTYFCKALAAHLGYKRLDEDTSIALHDTDGAPSIKVLKLSVSKREIVDETSAVLRARERVVMQRPQWSYALHLLPPSPDLLVIVLARNCLDVLISQNRIKWTCTHSETELAIFRAEAELDPALKAAAGDLDDAICAMKQRAYKHYQAAALARKGVATYAVAYTSFGTLSGFVNDTRARKAFQPKQVAVRTAAPTALLRRVRSRQAKRKPRSLLSS
jgi:hypothetical protein